MSELCLLAAVSLATSQGEPPALPLTSVLQETQELSEQQTSCDDRQTTAIAPDAEVHPPEFSQSSDESRRKNLEAALTPVASAQTIGDRPVEDIRSFSHLSTSELLAVPIWRTPHEPDGPIADERQLVPQVNPDRSPESNLARDGIGDVNSARPLAVPQAQEEPLVPWTSSLSPASPSTLDAASVQPEMASPAQPMSMRANGSPELVASSGAEAETVPEAVSFSFAVPQPQTKAVRPASGSQFYQQRWAALQAGQSYTRLTSDSFVQRWLYTSYEPTHEDWVNLLAHEARAMSRGQGNNRLTVMLGDSISLWFPTDYMARYRFWLNQSISGDTAAGTLQRLSLFNQTRPDIIHVMVGINDLRRGVSDAQLLATQRQILRRLRQQHPNAQIIAHSILPTRLPNLTGDRIQRINASLEAIATQEGARYLNLYHYFSDGQGGINPDLTTDGLHLNPQGYALWFAVLQQFNLV